MRCSDKTRIRRNYHAQPTSDYNQQRFHQAKQIHPGNVKKPAHVAGSSRPKVRESMETSPMSFNGIMYCHDSFSHVYALNAKDRRRKNSGITRMRLGRFTNLLLRGPPRTIAVVAVIRSKVYIATLDSKLVAIDAKTGTKAAAVRHADRSCGASLQERQKGRRRSSHQLQSPISPIAAELP